MIKKAVFFSLFCAVTLSLCCTTGHNRIVVSPENPQTISYPIKYPTHDEMRTLVNWIVRELSIGWLEHDWTFRITDQYIVGVMPDGQMVFADGITIPQTREIVIFPHQECLADSSLTEEISHALGYDHDDKHTGVLVMELVEQTRKKAILYFCPQGYKSKPPPKPVLR